MKTFQRKLFHALHVLHGNNAAWKRECMELLQIGKSAFYKRVRGETPMMIEEIVKIAQRFNISIDTLIAEKQSLLPFHFQGGVYNAFSARKYFAALLDDFFLIKSKPQARIFLVARDLPVFYFLEMKALLNFKIFHWEQTKPGRDVWQKEYVFIDWEKDWQMEEHCSFLSNFFKSLPRTEIWADDLFDRTLRQIAHHVETTPGFDWEEAEKVLEELQAVVIQMKGIVCHHYDTTVNGTRAALKIYENKTHELQNQLVVKWANQHSIQLPIDFPVYLKSYHQGIAEYSIETCRLLEEQSRSFESMGKDSRAAWFEKQVDKIHSIRKSQIFVFS